MLTLPAPSIAQIQGVIGKLNAFMTYVQNDITGFWTYTIIVIALVVSGGLIAIGGADSILKKTGSVILGGAIAVSSVSLVSSVSKAVGGSGCNLGISLTPSLMAMIQFIFCSSASFFAVLAIVALGGAIMVGGVSGNQLVQLIAIRFGIGCSLIIGAVSLVTLVFVDIL